MFNENSEQNKIITFSVLIIAIVAVAFAFYYAKSVLIPFVFALFLRTLISPIVDFQINRLRVYRQIAIPITFLIVIFFFFIIIPTLYNSIRSFLENANDYQDRVILLIDFLLRWAQNRLGIELDIITIEESIRDLPFLNWASDLLGHTAHFFETLFIILIILYHKISFSYC